MSAPNITPSTTSYLPEGLPIPVPEPDGLSAPYWAGLREGKLLVQRCKSCGTLRHPPGPVCPSCYSFEWDTLQASGRGTR